MFDGLLPEIDDLAVVDDAALVDAIKGWSRAESAASARKLAAVAELFCRRTGLDSAQDRQDWWIDPDGAVSVELGAALGTSRGLALAQAHRGVALRDRLPQVAELFVAGEITDLLVRAIVWRTQLVEDSEALAAVDEELAARVRRWGALTVTKTEQAIDAIVLDHDASALRRTSAAIRKRDVQFGSPTDEPGFTSLWARLYAHDGAAASAAARRNGSVGVFRRPTHRRRTARRRDGGFRHFSPPILPLRRRSVPGRPAGRCNEQHCCQCGGQRIDRRIRHRNRTATMQGASGFRDGRRDHAGTSAGRDLRPLTGARNPASGRCAARTPLCVLS